MNLQSLGSCSGYYSPTTQLLLLESPSSLSFLWLSFLPLPLGLGQQGQESLWLGGPRDPTHCTAGLCLSHDMVKRHVAQCSLQGLEALLPCNRRRLVGALLFTRCSVGGGRSVGWEGAQHVAVGLAALSHLEIRQPWSSS